MKVIDLSHSIYNEMSAYPSDPDIIITKRKNIAQHYSDLHEFTMGTHTGTHLDTPAHIFSKGKTLSDFPLTSFMGRFISGLPPMGPRRPSTLMPFRAAFNTESVKPRCCTPQDLTCEDHSHTLIREMLAWYRGASFSAC